MRKWFLLLWLLCPVAALYYHFNDGQDQLAREKARVRLEGIRALAAAKEPDWAKVVEQYDLLLAELPANERPLVRQQIRPEKARARIERLDVACAVQALEKTIARSSGFKGIYHELEFYGQCPECAETAAS